MYFLSVELLFMAHQQTIKSAGKTPTYTQLISDGADLLTKSPHCTHTQHLTEHLSHPETLPISSTHSPSSRLGIQVG